MMTNSNVMIIPGLHKSSKGQHGRIKEKGQESRQIKGQSHPVRTQHKS